MDSLSKFIRKLVVLIFMGALVSCGRTDGKAPAARSSGNQACSLYISVSDSACFLSLSFVTSTFAGTAGSAGSTDGTGTSARFSTPLGMTSYGSYIYVAESSSVIRRINIATGAVTTFAGASGFTGSTDGTGTTARFNSPNGITSDGTYLYVADAGNSTIRKINISTQEVTTFAGTAGATGSTDGVGAAARFNNPTGITSDGTYLYVAENINHTIRRIDMGTATVTTFAGSAGVSGSTNATGTAARFNGPYHLTTDGSSLYVSELSAHTIRKISISSAAVTLLAGQYTTSGSTDGAALSARFNAPAGLLYNNGYLYIVDQSNDTVRRLNLSADTVSTVLGTALSSGSTDGTGTAARFNSPESMATDGDALFISDSLNHTIRKVL